MGTPGAAGGLPQSRACPACGTENPPGMNFCRQCGAGLAAGPPPAHQPSPPPAAAPPATQTPAFGSAASAAKQTCPNCGGQTPAGFAFCQQCGGKLPPQQAAPPSAARPPQGMVSGETGEPPPDGAAHAATLAAQGREAANIMAGARSPGTADAPAWGMLVSVNRDGTDGRSFPLAGEWVDIGRADADLVFESDTFLARRHARIEHKGGVVTVIPHDQLNGVYRRVDVPQNIGDGTVLLAGREVLRFELVTDEERDARPLVRHGVNMFGSPPRRPWGRLSQLLPNGGVRDIRHLNDAEVVLGREDGDLVFEDDAFLSRRHAVFRWKDGRCILEDLESSNGTFVRITGPVTLKPGDHLRMGDQLFRFEPGGSGAR